MSSPSESPPSPAPVSPSSVSGEGPQPKSEATVEAQSKKPAQEDVVLIHGRTSDGQGLAVLRKQGETIEPGVVMPLVPGKPIVGDVVRLTPRKESPLVCDVKVEYKAEQMQELAALSTTHKGPAQVATERYRSNWDQIFGRDKDSVPDKLN